MITAIIVNYNSGVLLTACVASLFASSCPLKVVVSDNASSDDSLDRLELFLPEPGPGPMEQLRRQGQSRQRVRARPAAANAAKRWSWGEPG